jgi:hypothetical protein
LIPKANYTFARKINSQVLKLKKSMIRTEKIL